MLSEMSEMSEMSETRKDADNLTTEEWSNQDLRDLAEEALCHGDEEQARMCAEELRSRGAANSADNIDAILVARRPGLADMLEMVRVYRDFACGDNAEQAAAEWVAAGFSPTQAGEWLDARVFWASDARRLADAGVTADEVGEAGVGYDFANGDISLADAVAAAQATR